MPERKPSGSPLVVGELGCGYVDAARHGVRFIPRRECANPVAGTGPGSRQPLGAELLLDDRDDAVADGVALVLRRRPRP